MGSSKFLGNLVHNIEQECYYIKGFEKLYYKVWKVIDQEGMQIIGMTIWRYM